MRMYDEGMAALLAGAADLAAALPKPVQPKKRKR
jgi:hypothetical protein